MGKVLRLHWICSKVGGVQMTEFNPALNMISPVIQQPRICPQTATMPTQKQILDFEDEYQLNI